MSRKLRRIFDDHPVLPVAAVDSAESGPPLAKALREGGISIVEIMLRSDEALAAVERIVASEDIMVGLGTLLEADQFKYAQQVGAKFTTSPGLNLDLLSVADEEHIPYLPGVFTASEIMLARDHDYETLKYFPAFVPDRPRQTQYLQLASAFPQMRFCMTGGIDGGNFMDALAMSNVIAVGGTWIAPRELVAAGDWAQITERARHASSLTKGRVREGQDQAA